jgi:hypothetical protein
VDEKLEDSFLVHFPAANETTPRPQLSGRLVDPPISAKEQNVTIRASGRDFKFNIFQ